MQHPVIRKMKIKMTLRFHLTTVRMTKTKNSVGSRSWWGYGERGTLLYCWWDCKLYNYSGNQSDSASVIGHSTTWGTSYTTPGHIPKRCSTITQGHVLHYVHGSLICKDMNLQTTQKSINQKIDTGNVVHWNGILFTMESSSAIKNKDIMNFTGKWVELENIILSEVTQTQKDMHGMYPLISGY